MPHAIPSLIDACRASSSRPILEHLRFLESLPQLELGEVDGLFDAVADDERVEDWVPDAFARLLPPAFWVTRDLSPQGYDRVMLEGLARNALGPRYEALLVAAFIAAADPAEIIVRFEDAIDLYGLRLIDEHPGAWSKIQSLATHPRRDVRDAAARIATLGKRCTPEVVDAMRDLLVRATVVTESYDDQLRGEEVLGTIAGAGRQMAGLAPDLEQVLSSASLAFAASAARALGALGDPRSLEPLVRRQGELSGNAADYAICMARAKMRLACWQLGGDDHWLHGALDDAGGFIVYIFPLWIALSAAPPDDRLRAALELAAERPGWPALVCETLGQHGPVAAALVERITTRASADTAETIAFLHARWAVGLIDGASFLAGLEPVLTDNRAAWKSLVASELRTDGWYERIRRGIASGDRGALRALMGNLAVGGSFLPDLVRAGRDEEVAFAWRFLPPGRFWAALP